MPLLTNSDQHLAFVPCSEERLRLARHLAGNGIEIGALHRPLLPLPASVTMCTYVDRMTTPELRSTYPELAHHRFVNVGIVSQAEELDLAPESADYIIANHLIEHVEGTIRTIENFSRVLRPGGILYMAVPDMRYTFDRFRMPVTFDHLSSEYLNDYVQNREDHYREWVYNVDQYVHKLTLTDVEMNEIVLRYMKIKKSIHFHAWRFEDFIIHLYRMRHEFNLKLELIDVSKSPTKEMHEFIVVLQKYS